MTTQTQNPKTVETLLRGMLMNTWRLEALLYASQHMELPTKRAPHVPGHLEEMAAEVATRSLGELMQAIDDLSIELGVDTSMTKEAANG